MFNSTKTKLLILVFLLSGICSFAQTTQSGTPCDSPVQVWDKHFGGNGQDKLEALCLTADGGFLLGGYSFSKPSGDKKEKLIGDYDFWVVKTDADGKKIWEKTFGGIEREHLKSIIPTKDGGYLLGGHSGSGKSGSKTQELKGIIDYWLVKIDANGKKIWDKSYGGDSDQYLSAVMPTDDGGYLLAGHTSAYGGGDKTAANHGQSDFWVVKTDANGNKLWDKSYGGEGIELLYSAIPTKDGNFLLGGATRSGISGNKTTAVKGETDYWLVKINGKGDIIWDKTYGGSGEDLLHTLFPTNDGGYLLGGESASPVSGDKTENSFGESDYWVIKTDANGTKLWDKRMGGPTTESVLAISATNDGGYLIAGDSWSNLPGIANTGRDFWAVKIDAGGSQLWDLKMGGSGNEELSHLLPLPDGTYLLAGGSESDMVSGTLKEPGKGGSDFLIIKLAVCK